MMPEQTALRVRALRTALMMLAQPGSLWTSRQMLPWEGKHPEHWKRRCFERLTEHAVIQVVKVVGMTRYYAAPNPELAVRMGELADGELVTYVETAQAAATLSEKPLPQWRRAVPPKDPARRIISPGSETAAGKIEERFGDVVKLLEEMVSRTLEARDAARNAAALAMDASKNTTTMLSSIADTATLENSLYAAAKLVLDVVPTLDARTHDIRSRILTNSADLATAEKLSALSDRIAAMEKHARRSEQKVLEKINVLSANMAAAMRVVFGAHLADTIADTVVDTAASKPLGPDYFDISYLPVKKENEG